MRPEEQWGLRTQYLCIYRNYFSSLDCMYIVYCFCIIKSVTWVSRPNSLGMMSRQESSSRFLSRDSSSREMLGLLLKRKPTVKLITLQGERICVVDWRFLTKAALATLLLSRMSATRFLLGDIRLSWKISSSFNRYSAVPLVNQWCTKPLIETKILNPEFL